MPNQIYSAGGVEMNVGLNTPSTNLQYFTNQAPGNAGVKLSVTSTQFYSFQGLAGVKLSVLANATLN